MDKKSVKKAIIFTVILLLVVYLFGEELAEAVLEMRSLSVWALAAAFLLCLLYQAAEGWNLTVVAREKDGDFSRWDGFTGMLYTSFFRVVTFGSAPAAATAVYLNRRGIPAVTGTGISAILYVMHKLSIAFLCILLLGLRWGSLRSLYREYFRYLLLSLGLIAVIAGFLLALCFGEHLHSGLIRLACRWDRNGKYQEAIGRIGEQLRGLREFSGIVMGNRRVMAKLMLCNTGKLFCWYLIPGILLRGRLKVGLADCVAVMAFVTAVAGVLPAPAGIGSTEFAFMLLFRGLAKEPELLSCALVYRFMTYILPGLLGGIWILADMIKKNKRKRKGKR